MRARLQRQQSAAAAAEGQAGNICIAPPATAAPPAWARPAARKPSQRTAHSAKASACRLRGGEPRAPRWRDWACPVRAELARALTRLGRRVLLSAQLRAPPAARRCSALMSCAGHRTTQRALLKCSLQNTVYVTAGRAPGDNGSGGCMHAAAVRATASTRRLVLQPLGASKEESDLLRHAEVGVLEQQRLEA